MLAQGGTDNYQVFIENNQKLCFNLSKILTRKVNDGRSFKRFVSDILSFFRWDINFL